MKKKLFLLPLLMCGMIGLSSCTIFNDDDIKTALDEYMGIIQEERNKTYEKSQLSKACIGKSENEKAKLIDDYIKRTNKNA